MTQEPLFGEFCEPVSSGKPPISAKTRPEQARLYRPVRDQVEFVLRDLDSVLGPDHLARAIWQLVEALDLLAFYAPIKAVEGEPGHPATDPRVLVALWIYASADGVGKARQLDRLCHEHDAYRWIRGGVPINYHLLSDFRIGNREALDEVISEVLAAMMAEGFVSVERVSQDGMRVRGSAGASSFRREPRVREFLAQAQAQVQRLAEEVDAVEQGATAGATTSRLSRRQRAAQERAARERLARVQEALGELPAVRKAKQTDRERENARVSTTDSEARVMKMPDGGFRPAYNVELATDTATQVIVGYGVINRGSDSGEASPMLAQVEKRTTKTPNEYLADGGFATLDEVDKFDAASVTLYAPTRAPRGQSRQQSEPRPGDSEAVAAWRVRMSTEEAQTIYRERAATSECVNAQWRWRQGLSQFLVRGLAKVTCVVAWMVLTHNLLRWIALRS